MKGAPEESGMETAKSGSYAVTRQRPTSLVPVALISAVVSALGFLVIATVVDGIRWSPADPVEKPIAGRDPASEVVPAEEEGAQPWLPTFRQESAELEVRLKELRFELDDTKAEAERYLQELVELVAELNLASGDR